MWRAVSRVGVEDAPQRVYDLRDVYNGLRYIARSGAPWRWLPNDLPPWPVVYQQTQRWLKAEVFQEMVHDLREILRMAQGRNAEPTAVILDSRTMQSSPESGGRDTMEPNAVRGAKYMWQ